MKMPASTSATKTPASSATDESFGPNSPASSSSGTKSSSGTDAAGENTKTGDNKTADSQAIIDSKKAVPSALEFFEAFAKSEVGRRWSPMIGQNPAVLPYLDGMIGAGNNTIVLGSINVGGNWTGRDHITSHVLDHTLEHVPEHATGHTKAASRTFDFVTKPVSYDFDRLHRIYIKTSAYEEARLVVLDRHLVILQGAPNSGKWCSALNLLSEIQPRNIHEVNLSIKELSALRCMEEHSYIIKLTSPNEAQFLNAHTLKSLSWELKEKHSHLVITVNSSPGRERELLSEYIVQWRDLPANYDLLSRHLSWYMPEDCLLEKGEAVSQHDLIVQLLESALRPGDVDKLAKSIAQTVKSGGAPEDVMLHFAQSADVHKQVGDWFDAHPKIHHQLFMTTLAVLNGCSYSDIIRERVQFEQKCKIAMNGFGPVKELEEPAYSQKLSDLLDEVCAHVSTGYTISEYGPAQGQTIVLNNVMFQPAVLYYVWHELPDYRAPLLSWIYEMGISGRHEVRYRAAAACGEISRYDFKEVCDIVLGPWATHAAAQVRQLVAIAINIPVLDDRVALQVLRLLDHWSTVDNFHLRWCAATVYGGHVGSCYPQIALSALFDIAQCDDMRLLLPVSASLVTLFNRVSQRLSLSSSREPNSHDLSHDLILKMLIDWTQPSQAKATVRSGLLVFWAVLCETETEVEFSASFPTLLWLYDTSPEYEDMIWLLLRRALNLKDTRKAVLEQLYDWVKAADSTPQLLPAISKVLFRLSLDGDAIEKERMTHYLARWALQGSLTAQQIKNAFLVHAPSHETTGVARECLGTPLPNTTDA